MRRELRRSQVEGFFRKLPATEIALEACAGSHHWGRMLTGMGHRVQLDAPDLDRADPGLDDARTMMLSLFMAYYVDGLSEATAFSCSANRAFRASSSE